MVANNSLADEINEEIKTVANESRFRIDQLNKAYLRGKADGIEEFFNMSLRDFITLIRGEKNHVA